MVYIFLANGFEETEALVPLDYLRRCEEIQVKTVAVNMEYLVTGSHDICVLADLLMDEINLEMMEMAVLPGGMPGTLNLEHSERLQEVLDYAAEKGIFIGAICAAPSILGHKGLLEEKRATCYIGFEDQLGRANYTGQPVEQDGNIITARGAGVANQFAFKLIEVLRGKERANKIKAGILWQE